MSRQIFVPSALSDLTAAIKARAVTGTGCTAWNKLTGGTRLTDLATVGTDGQPGQPIPNGVLTSAVNGQLATFFGPDEVSSVFIEYKGGSARQAVNASGPAAQGDGGSTPATTYTYDAGGNVVTETAGGVTTTYTYNGDGTIHQSTRAGITRTYTYDANGNVTAVA